MGVTYLIHKNDFLTEDPIARIVLDNPCGISIYQSFCKKKSWVRKQRVANVDLLITFFSLVNLQKTSSL